MLHPCYAPNMTQAEIDEVRDAFSARARVEIRNLEASAKFAGHDRYKAECKAAIAYLTEMFIEFREPATEQNTLAMYAEDRINGLR